MNRLHLAHWHSKRETVHFLGPNGFGHFSTIKKTLSRALDVKWHILSTCLDVSQTMRI